MTILMAVLLLAQAPGLVERGLRDLREGHPSRAESRWKRAEAEAMRSLDSRSWHLARLARVDLALLNRDTLSAALLLPPLPREPELATLVDLGRAKLEVVTGRPQNALDRVMPHARGTSPAQASARLLAAQSLLALGRPAQAIDMLRENLPHSVVLHARRITLLASLAQETMDTLTVQRELQALEQRARQTHDLIAALLAAEEQARLGDLAADWNRVVDAAAAMELEGRAQWLAASCLAQQPSGTSCRSPVATSPTP